MMRMALEKAAFTGEGPGGIRMPCPNHHQPNESFKEYLKTLPQRAAALPPEKREDFLHSIALLDVEEPIKEALGFHGLSWERDPLPLGSEGLTALVQDMPSRRTEFHLHHYGEVSGLVVREQCLL